MNSTPSRHAVVIGDALVDELIDERNVTRVAGGSALNVAVGLALLGTNSTLIASVASDDDGRTLDAHTQSFGVRRIWSPNPLGTGVARSERVDGEPRYSFNAAARSRTLIFSAEAIEQIASADIVVISGFPFDNAEECAALSAALEHRRGVLAIDPNPRAGMLVDAARFAEGLEVTARDADLVKIGEEDAALLYQEPLLTSAHRLLDSGARFVLATAGAGGAALVAEHVELTRAIVSDPRPIIDTMGAGDATLAVVAASLATDGDPSIMEWESILGRAMATAAETIRHPGAVLRMPI